MVDIIGAGFGRTGTSSLRQALELLGFAPCHHMSEVLRHPRTAVSWTAALRGDLGALSSLVSEYRTTLDFPSCLLWRELTELYPDAKVVLTVREPKAWYDSARATILNRERNSAISDDVAALLKPFSAAMAARGFRRDLSEQQTIESYLRHNEAVRDGVAPSRLLEFDVAQGWGPLCAFLGVGVPDLPFPWGNDSASFHRNVERVLDARQDGFR